MSKCETCGYAVRPSQNPQIRNDSYGCRLSGTIVKNVKECPHAVNISSTCPICGRPIPENSGFIPHEHPVLLCNECGEQLYSCGTCSHKQNCAIENYTGPKPKVVTKTIQAGPVTQQFQTINPELEQELCPTCICGGRTNCALLGRCDNWDFMIKEEAQ